MAFDCQRPGALCCRAPLQVAQARISSRHNRLLDASDASPEVAAAMAAAIDAWPSAICRDTTERPELTVNKALEAIRALPQ